MLEFIRNFFSGWIAWIVIGILVFVFAVWGIGNYFTDSGEVIVAEVGDEQITDRQFNERWLAYQRQMRERFGDIFDSGLFEESELRRQVLDAMIDERVLQLAAADARFAVSDEMLRTQIRRFDAFRVGDEFSPEVYRSQLTMAGMTVGGFEGRMRSEMLADQMRGLAAVTAIATDAEIERFVALRDQERDFDFRLYRASDFADDVVIEESDIEAYYQENTSQFMAPAEAMVEYVELTAEQVVDLIEVDEALLRTRYEQARRQFMSEEVRVASHILFEFFPDAGEDEIAEKRALADEVYQRIQDGESFEELARAYSDDPGSAMDGGDLGEVERGMMVDAFERALFDLDEGEVSPPVRSEFGFHIIYNREIIESEGQSFEEARERLAEEAREIELDRAMLEQTDRLMTLTFENDGNLLAVADGMGLELKTAGPIRRDGGEGIFADRQVLDAVFSERVIAGSSSDPISLDDQHVVVVAVTEYTPAQPRELDQVREQIVERLRRERSSVLANEAAVAAREGLEPVDDAPLAALAGDEGEDVEQAREIKRNSTDYPRALVQAVFRMPRPAEQSVEIAVLDAGNGNHAVVALRAVRDGSMERLSGGQIDDVREQLGQGMVNAESPALVQYLRSQYRVTINEDRLRARAFD